MHQDFSFFHSSRYKWLLSCAYGIFLYLFLIVFLPFGVSNYDPNHQYTLAFLLEIGIFVPVTILVSLFNEFILKAIFKDYQNYPFVISWTVWSLVLLGIIIFIVYNYLGNWHDWRWSSLPGFVFNTGTVLVFPATAMFFYYRYKTLRENYDTVLTNTNNSIDDKQMIFFTGEGSKENLSVTVADFVYAQAQDNYIEIKYLKNGVLSKFLIRSSLTALKERLEYDFLVRCHRSYLVNLYNVHSIKGSINDLQITMSHFNAEIPVSRTYAADTLESLRKYKRFQ